MIYSYATSPLLHFLHLVMNLLFKLILGMIVETVFESNSIIKEGK